MKKFLLQFSIVPVMAVFFITAGSAMCNPSRNAHVPTVANGPQQQSEEKIYRSVEQMPQFPGGDAALLKYIQSHLQYPEGANASGSVIVQFVVETDGSVGQIKVVRSVHELLDKEAVRVVKGLPKFTPGRQNGQPVAVWYTLPIMFKGENALMEQRFSQYEVPNDSLEDETALRSAEQMPQFPGGDAALLKYIQSHLQYPEGANANGIVIVQFVVGSNGSVGQVKVLRSIHELLDKEAVRVVKGLPKFTPGRQNGQPVAVWYTLPVSFRENHNNYLP